MLLVFHYIIFRIIVEFNGSLILITTTSIQFCTIYIIQDSSCTRICTSILWFYWVLHFYAQYNLPLFRSMFVLFMCGHLVIALVAYHLKHVKSMFVLDKRAQALSYFYSNETQISTTTVQDHISRLAPE